MKPSILVVVVAGCATAPPRIAHVALKPPLDSLDKIWEKVCTK